MFKYLEDDLVAGILKDYADSKYAFVAMLPKEGVAVSDYMASLTGEHLQTLLADPQKIQVRTSLPKFEIECKAELSSVLQSMGMTLPFTDGGLDGIGTSAYGPLIISRVLHKTYIVVDEKGTRAGAASAVGMAPASEPPSDYKEVYLDRPFVYMIVDREANI